MDLRIIFRLAKPASFKYNLHPKKARLARAEIYSYSSPPLPDKEGIDLSAIGQIR